VPAAWLGLSQLHTLRDVHLNVVSTAAIAAALPRLHTLTAYAIPLLSLDEVSGFFTDLLPRLRVFHFRGWWPVEAATSAAAPLPLLEELVWIEHKSGMGRELSLPTAFLGARPTVLHAPYELFANSLPARGGASGEPARSSFLSRVCDLHLDAYTSISVSDVAQVLRAAPQLRRLHCDFYLRRDRRWITSLARPRHPGFVGLFHPRLRCLHVSTDVPASCDDASASCDDARVSRLRGTCFPRLRELKLIDAMLPS
jgi:hypothetical protein